MSGMDEPVYTHRDMDHANGEISRLKAEVEKLREENEHHKFLLYRAYFLYRPHKNTEGQTASSVCPTFYDGCNCLVPYDDFDVEYYNSIYPQLKAEAALATTKVDFQISDTTCQNGMGETKSCGTCEHSDECAK